MVSREAKIIGLDSIVIKPMYQTKEFNTQMQFLDRRNHTGQNPSIMTGSHLNILTDELKYLINETTETDTGASDRTRRRYVPREAKIIGLDSIVSKTDVPDQGVQRSYPGSRQNEPHRPEPEQHAQEPHKHLDGRAVLPHH